jgi:succinate-semialdehyde dehydrogenase/glutarate-semialdehyde dehydrogenase
MTSINPATGETIAEYDEHDDATIERKLDLAREAFGVHRASSFEERAVMMRNVARLLRERADRYGRLMTSEMGKPLGAARAEVEKCALVCDYYAEHAATFLADEIVESDAARSYISYQPIGAVLAIMPWNFPFWQCFRFAAPALMAGNVGLLKHASNVPGSALAIEEVIRDAGFPEGAFQTLLVGSARVGGLIADDRIAAVTLTGSEEAGRKVGEAAGHAIKKVVLELGGSDPFIVMPSADLEKAATTAVTARTINNGQSCIAAKRFIVHESIAEEFERRMAEGLRKLRLGDPMEEGIDIGPLARPEFVDDIERQVRESIEKGARLVTGGERGDRKGYFYQPTLLADVAAGMPAYEEETFGPVAALIRVKDISDAIRVANDSRFGLGASAWTNDESERDRFVREIEAGSLFINGMVKSDPRLPFGGVKASGVGRELGEFGIREFVNIKTVWMGDSGTTGRAGRRDAE